MNEPKTISRRQFFGRSGFNLGAISLWSLLANDAIAGASPRPLQSKASHFVPQAKRVIFLNMNGAPPQLDMFDYKPQLQPNLQQMSHQQDYYFQPVSDYHL